MFSSCAEKFFEYALALFAESGHTDATEPEFTNHSAKQFIYLDCDKNISFSRKQRDILLLFDNISRLFTIKGIAFFSLNLLVSSSERSQAVHNSHVLIQSVVNDQATICMSRHDDEIIFSFAGYGLTCILSDWYSNEYKILERLDIANMTITDNREYFFDFVSIFARHYYFSNKQTFYDSLPLNFFSNWKSDITREEIEEFLIEQRFSVVKEYANDYVGYDTPSPEEYIDNEYEFDLVLQEAENVQISFSEEEDSLDQTEADEYDLSDISPEVFDDPELLLNYIEKYSNKINNNS
ncbi:MAG: hypothetical protein IJG33_15175 [Selenomonadaceae bacterium]|nr:hypothetical protein [Selenomonadaceae bacterium]MBR0288119.1 hypothetical protein [Selenomonadaceae bacterium]